SSQLSHSVCNFLHIHFERKKLPLRSKTAPFVRRFFKLVMMMGKLDFIQATVGFPLQIEGKMWKFPDKYDVRRPNPARVHGHGARAATRNWWTGRQ
ncbi:hypothetical protein, partial [Achromobacter sp. GbtcB20]|uniref:hypothetical protein n=1 Tax=Achromobacter sp. GbtcB20 TaxID=2824765 RepID=UPI001C308287